jgi:hypothetical protein
VLTGRDRAYCEKIAAQQERPWFERRGIDYAQLVTGLLVLVWALRAGRADLVWLAGSGGFLIGGSLAFLVRSRDQRILAALCREAERAGAGRP